MVCKLSLLFPKFKVDMGNGGPYHFSIFLTSLNFKTDLNTVTFVWLNMETLINLFWQQLNSDKVSSALRMYLTIPNLVSSIRLIHQTVESYSTCTSTYALLLPLKPVSTLWQLNSTHPRQPHKSQKSDIRLHPTLLLLGLLCVDMFTCEFAVGTSVAQLSSKSSKEPWNISFLWNLIIYGANAYKYNRFIK